MRPDKEADTNHVCTPEQDLRMSLWMHKHCFAWRQINVTLSTAELSVATWNYGAKRSRQLNLYYFSGSRPPWLQTDRSNTILRQRLS